MSDTLPVLLNKQPILDHSSRVVAFHFALESTAKEPLSDQQWLTAIGQFTQDVENVGGVESLTKGLPIYYSAPISLLKLEYLPIKDPAKMTVEVDDAVLGNKEVLQNLKEMIQAGVKVAITGFSNTQAEQKLLTLAHEVKISTEGETVDSLKLALEGLPDGKSVVLTHVDTQERYEAFVNAGFKFFQGYYFTDPIIAKSQKVEESSFALLKLLASLNDPNVDFNDVSQIIAADAALSHKLLTAINHPTSHVDHQVDSLKDAVMLMGLKRLKFWVNMMMMSQVQDVPQELMVTALVRAKFLEAIAESTGKKDEEEKFFMVGLFSTLNAFLKVPMVDIADTLPVCDDVKQALTSQQGSMGRALFIVRALEQGNTQLIMMGHEGMGLMEVSSSYMKASGWAHQTMAALAA